MQKKGLIDYEMSIAIENASLDGYPRKINDCFITLTMPIYYGAQISKTIYDGDDKNGRAGQQCSSQFNRLHK